LVFLQNNEHIPLIAQARARKSGQVPALSHYDKALEALSKGDPFIYAPNYRDAGNVWQLNSRKDEQ
jgi:hypothetical protein